MMNETEKMIEVMQAFVDGKQIQLQRKNWDSKEWGDCNNPAWDWGSNNYRIKPESKYHPYKDTDEMIADYEERFEMKQVVGGLMYVNSATPMIWVKSKDGNSKHIITDYYQNSVWCGACSYTMQQLIDAFVYIDGSPCGKLVGE